MNKKQMKTPNVKITIPKVEKMYAINHLSEAISTLSHALLSPIQVDISNNTFSGIGKGYGIKIDTPKE